MIENIKNKTKKYILLQNDYTVAYDDENYYVNNKVQDSKKNEDKTPTKEDIEKQANDLKIQQLYNSFLKKHFKNIVVLTGAGSSMDSGGKSMFGLWKECREKIESIYKSTLCNIKLKEIARNKDIEAFISYITLKEKTENEQGNTSNLKEKHQELEKKIRELCTLTLQKDKAPHIDFLNKITARKNNDSRVQIFTTNYDTLFEQAANEAGFVIIDGFSFTQPREFSGRWFDLDIVNREKTRLKQEESFISKVFHLYKLHGSLTWTKKDDGKIVQENNPNPLMIYPSSEKYESSYEQPYFEMMSRFQQALRKEETLLIVIGFGFGDKHIRNVVLEAVNQNPSFQLLILNYGNITPNENIKDFFINKENFVVKRNINIVSGSFKEFTDNYPENKTYYNSNESI